MSKPQPIAGRGVANTTGLPGAPADLSSMVRGALAEALALRPDRRMGFFVQPGVLAWTEDEPALAGLMRELVNAIVVSSTPSTVATFIFDVLAAREPNFYALTLVAPTDDPTTLQIPHRARDIASALGVHVWEVPGRSGEADSLCFALQTA